MTHTCFRAESHRKGLLGGWQNSTTRQSAAMVCPMRFALVGISAVVAVVALALSQCRSPVGKGGLERRASNAAMVRASGRPAPRAPTPRPSKKACAGDGAAAGARCSAWQARAMRMWSCVSMCRRGWLRFPVARCRAGGARSSTPCGRPGSHAAVHGVPARAARAQVDTRNWRRALLDMFTGLYLWRVGCALYEGAGERGEHGWQSCHAAAVKAS